MSGKRRALVTIDLTGERSPGGPGGPPPRQLASVVISLDSDVSFEQPASPAPAPAPGPAPRNKKPHKKKNAPASDKENAPSPLGDCPICFEELGKSLLASTRCGHVFCMRCLERALHIERRCPTCRRALKSHTAYHPLFLGNH